jgi:MYXO-CTERM domain-containing protein
VVYGDEKNCLDPGTTFSVYSPENRIVTGEDTRLRLFANRQNTAIRYRWIVQQQPEGSTATVTNPMGTVRRSTPYEYHYVKGNVASLTADEPGVYQIKVAAELVFADTVNTMFPKTASYIVTIHADGDSTGGCSVGNSNASGLGMLLLLLGLGFIIRRRRR